MKNKKTIFLSLSVLFCCLPFIAASAAEPQKEEVTIATSDGKNVYAAGFHREISDAISGDLYIAGLMAIDITGRIGGDLGAAGGKLEITAPIGDDARLAGQYVTVSSPEIGGSVVAAGQNVVFRSMSKVNGDVWAYGAFVELHGSVAKNVKIGADRVIINGPITGDAEIEASSVTFGEKGFINGKLTLKASENVPREKVGGEILFTKWEHTEQGESDFVKQTHMLWTPFSIAMLISTLLIGLLFLAFFKNFGVLFADTVKENAFVSMGIGFLTLIAFPFLVMLLLITFFGIPLAFLTLFVFISMMIFTCLISGLVVGAYLFPIKKTLSLWNIYGAFAAGTVIVFLIGMIPYFGLVLKFLIFLTALGALLRVKYDIVSTLRRAKKI